jgi:hypothetical protein
MLAMSLASSDPPSFERLLQAMNDPTDEHISLAFTEDATLDRHSGTDPDTGQPGALRETFRGRVAILRWLATTPKKFSFGLLGLPYPSTADALDIDALIDLDPEDAGDYPADSDQWRSKYAIYGPDHFENRGIWRARFDSEGRVVWLSHRPFALRQ